MNEPIQLSYTSSVSDAVDAFRFHWRGMIRLWARVLLRVVGGLVLLLCIASIVTSGVTLRATVLLALTIYGLFILPFEATYRYRKAYLKAPSANAHIVCTITDESVSSSVGTLGSATLTWPLISKCVHTPRGFLLYTGNSSFLWLPLRAFRSEADRLTALAIFKRGIPKSTSVA